jgi:hypothetical protein
MARAQASLGINFSFHFGRGYFDADTRRFLAAPKCFPKPTHNHTHDPPPCLFQVEQEANKSRDNHLPEQRAQSGIYVGNNHNQKSNWTINLKR